MRENPPEEEPVMSTKRYKAEQIVTVLRQIDVEIAATHLADSTLRLGNLPNSLSLVSRRTMD
jgi:hypothetical protein